MEKSTVKISLFPFVSKIFLVIQYEACAQLPIDKLGKMCHNSNTYYGDRHMAERSLINDIRR